MKRRFFLTTVLTALAVTACNHDTEKVVADWPDGSPQIVYVMRGKEGKAVKIAERRYYENGELQCEKFYTAQGTAPDGEWSFYHDNGRLFARGKFDATHPQGGVWHFYTREGASYLDAVDSVRVVELGEVENPATVYFYHDSTMTIRQFYSTGMLRCQGSMVNGQREGLWQFYFSNGQLQTEATFTGGKENGTYTVYRENGVPYYRGQYRLGTRVGAWELYDEQANLISTQQYDR